MPSFSTALSGLESNNTALNTIANNIANLSTVGFKDQTDQFSTLFYQQLSSGANGGVQVGVGTQIAQTTTDFSDGGTSSTGKATDLALQGNGFFVINDNGQQELTRAGDFVLSQSGALQTTDGASVLGYAAVNGSLTASGALQPLSVPLGQTLPAKATGSLGIQANLDASSAVGSSVPAPVTLYDSLGFAHQGTVTFTKTAANTWNYNVSLPPGDAAGPTANTTGQLTFDGAGTLLTPGGSIGGINFSGLSDGANSLTFSWNLTGPNGTLTQTASASNIGSTTQDGYTSGNYQSFSVGGDGIIQAAYSNGQKQVIGQVAIGTVANLQGLQATSGTAFLATRASGNALIGPAGTGNRGTIQGGALESSNVDVSREFSALIVAQRAFEANSKTVTTFDTTTEEAINLIH